MNGRIRKQGDLMSDVIIRNNSNAIMHELENRKAEILKKIGIQAATNAKLNVTNSGRVDTGRMRNSITSEVVGNTVFIGSNVPYAVWHEVGTGIYADDGNGRQNPWAYQDSHGQWHNTRGLKPVHFLKRAFSEHMDEYEQITVNILKK